MKITGEWLIVDHSKSVLQTKAVDESLDSRSDDLYQCPTNHTMNSSKATLYCEAL